MFADSDSRAEIIVTGHVQGVGYRYATLRMARSLNLTGYVKNLPDGSVFISVQGRQDTINLFIDWCHKGPDRAIVENVQIIFKPLAEYGIFQIR